MKTTWGAMNGPDRLVLIGSTVVFIALFLPWYGYSVGGSSASIDGWRSWGLLSVLGVATAAIALWESHRPNSGFHLPQGISTVSIRLAAAVFMTAGSVLFLVEHHSSFASTLIPVSFGPEIGGYLALIGALIVLAGSIIYRRNDQRNI
ncbi:MAG: hypothetical protein ACYDHP_08140 [Ferrimicrobium sp.]